MNRHFVNYAALPCAPLGEPKGAEKQQASDGEWKPLRPGYESRTLAGGATEVRSTPGYRPDVAPSVQREPAYQPEGFGYAHVDHRGHQGEVIPKRSELDPGRVMPEDVHGSCLKPAPVDPLDDLAERVANDSGMYRRLIEHRGGCRCCVSPPCSACCEPLTQHEAEVLGWLDEEAAAPPVVKRVAKPALAAADVPEGATHRCRTYGLFYRVAGTAVEYLASRGQWARSTFDAEHLKDTRAFERLPQPAAPTEWQAKPPTVPGWYDTDDGDRAADIEPRHWNGSGWSYCPTANADIETKLGAARGERTSYIVHCWRGPRLVGPDWPEPQQ